jgi:peptidoglycan/LPS O-acetylase OafA/YrhL
MAPLARTRWKLLLVVAGIVQAIVTVIRYVGLFNPSLSALTLVPPWLFISIAFFFPFGIVFGFQMKTIHPQLVRFRWVLFACAAVFAIFAIIEQEYLYRNTSLPYGATFPSISTSLWSAFIILSFLGFENLKIPFTKFFNDIGNKTYGIYLTHPLILTIVSKMTYHLFPDLLAFYLVFLLILVPLAIGLPLLAMRVYTRLPIKKSYRYVFG